MIFLDFNRSLHPHPGLEPKSVRCARCPICPDCPDGFKPRDDVVPEKSTTKESIGSKHSDCRQSIAINSVQTKHFLLDIGIHWLLEAASGGIQLIHGVLVAEMSTRKVATKEDNCPSCPETGRNVHVIIPHHAWYFLRRVADANFSKACPPCPTCPKECFSKAKECARYRTWN